MSEELDILKRLDGSILATKVYMDDAKLQDMGVEQDPELVDIFIDLADCCAIYPATIKGKPGVLCNLSGMEIIVDETIDQFYVAWATIKNHINGTELEEYEDDESED